MQSKFSGGSQLRIISDYKKRDFEIKIKSNKYNWLIDYKNNVFRPPTGVSIVGKELRMSEIIGKILKNIIIKKTCNLTNFNDTADQYEIVLSTFIKHWNKAKNLNEDLIPIT